MQPLASGTLDGLLAAAGPVQGVGSKQGGQEGGQESLADGVERTGGSVILAQGGGGSGQPGQVQPRVSVLATTSGRGGGRRACVWWGWGARTAVE